jgi:hypothetical protein
MAVSLIFVMFSFIGLFNDEEDENGNAKCIKTRKVHGGKCLIGPSHTAAGFEPVNLA